jgi:SAM-dependent methyltransferase
VRRWDRADGDAATLHGVPDGSYDFLHASHILEHLNCPNQALSNWVRVVKPGGTLLISVPHQDLYEQKDAPPSRWAPEHQHFYRPWPLFRWLNVLAPSYDYRIQAVQVGDWGYERSTGPGGHPQGEYCIDAVLVKARRR